MDRTRDISDSHRLGSSEVPRFRYRWIAFDAVGTLIYPETPVAVAYQAVAARHGSLLTVVEFERCFRSAFQYTEKNPFPGGPTTRNQFTKTNDEIEAARWRWIVHDLIHDLPDTEACFRELFDHFAKPESWKCFDDVEQTLDRLEQAGYRLAVASNFDSRLHRILDSLPELRRISTRVISSDVGFRKPDPRFYEALTRCCDCTPDQVFMVGDSPEHDLAGPRAAGMSALLIKRSGYADKSRYVSSLNELADRLC